MKRSRSRAPRPSSEPKRPRKKTLSKKSRFAQELIVFFPDVLCWIIREYWKPVVIRIRSARRETNPNPLANQHTEWFHWEISKRVPAGAVVDLYLLSPYGLKLDLFSDDISRFIQKDALPDREDHMVQLFVPDRPVIEESGLRVVVSEDRIRVFDKRPMVRLRFDIPYKTGLVHTRIYLCACNSEDSDEMDLVCMTHDKLFWIHVNHGHQTWKSKSFADLKFRPRAFDAWDGFLAISSRARRIFLCEWQTFLTLDSDDDRSPNDSQVDEEDKIQGFDLQMIDIPLDALECEDIRVVGK